MVCALYIVVVGILVFSRAAEADVRRFKMINMYSVSSLCLCAWAVSLGSVVSVYSHTVRAPCASPRVAISRKLAV